MATPVPDTIARPLITSDYIKLDIDNDYLGDIPLDVLSMRAVGRFSYKRSGDSRLITKYNPLNDVCIPLEGGATHVSDGSDKTAVVFSNIDCTGYLASVSVDKPWDAT
ncbi:hypothetical protein BGX27_011225, partial [Mortierella sp. AM989]